MAKLWTSTALSQSGNPYGLIAVLAETREEAITKAGAELAQQKPGYVPDQKYVRALLDNLHEMTEDSDVVIDWDAARRR